MTTLLHCLRSLGCVTALLGSLACGELVSDEPAGAPSAPSPSGLAALMHRVHFAYRDDGTALRGGHGTYLASVPHAAARLVFTPQRATAGGAVDAGDAVQVQTLGAWRGSAAIASAAAAPAVAADGSAIVARGAILERLRNTADGVEQTFELDRAPAGAGPLTVRVAVTGQPLVARTETGFHFRAPDSALGVRYGAAIWVDAAGRRTPLDASMRDGAIEIAVPGDVLDAAAYPAMIDPVIGPEIAVGIPAVAAAQFTPDVARNFQTYLVVWADDRAGNSDIYGARFDFGGRLLGPAPIPISTAAKPQTHPAVASDGKQFLVVWDDARSPITGADIYATLVDESGTVASPAGVVVSNAVGDQRDPDVAFDEPSQCYQVVWSDLRSGISSDIYGTQVDRIATVLSPAGVAVSPFAGSARVQPAIANMPGKFLVTWTDIVGSGPPLIRGAMMNNAGGVMIPAFPIAAAASTTSAVASDGTNFLVAWQRADLTAIDGCLVGPASSVTGAVPLSPIAAGTLDPALAYDGANYGLVYSRTQSLYGRRIKPSGALLDPEIEAGSGNDLFEPALAAAKATLFFVAYDRFDATPPAHQGVFTRTVAF